VFFTTGSVHVSQVVGEITKDIEGVFAGDAGYLLRKEVFQELYERHRHIMSVAGKNMKRVMSEEQKQVIQGPELHRNDVGCIERTVPVSVPPGQGNDRLVPALFYSIISFLPRPSIDSSCLNGCRACS
jgi:hypothetical protein